MRADYITGQFVADQGVADWACVVETHRHLTDLGRPTEGFNDTALNEANDA
ncbi:MAG: hypothetical protein Aurels2KO_50090 [Aureliella sp.]